MKLKRTLRPETLRPESSLVLHINFYTPMFCNNGFLFDPTFLTVLSCGNIPTYTLYYQFNITTNYIILL